MVAGMLEAWDQITYKLHAIAALVAAKIGSKMSLTAPCTTRSRIAGIERTRTLPPSLGISRFRAGR